MCLNISLLADEAYLLIVELTKLILCIVMFEADGMTNVLRSGIFKNKWFIHKFILSCCRNTIQKTINAVLKRSRAI